jgi:predicted RNA-binding protein YlxR (DUF448 family)
VACGRSAAKVELVRLVVRDGVLAVDREQRLAGRGAYVCGGACLRRAAARGGISRSLRRHVTIDAQTVESVG